MNRNLFIEGMIKLVSGIILMIGLLFIPAGTFDYWNGKLLMVLLFVPMFLVGCILYKTNPQLLKRRLSAKEKEGTQKKVILLSGLMFICAFVVAGFSFRHQFLMVSKRVSIFFSILFLLGYGLFGLVLKQNEYLSRTIEVSKNQRLVDTGLYSIVRHPMYSATLIMFLSMGLVLGSICASIILCLYIPILLKRIENEEKVLEQGLKGYIEYKKKVKYKLIPWIY